MTARLEGEVAALWKIGLLVFCAGVGWSKLDAVEKRLDRLSVRVDQVTATLSRKSALISPSQRALSAHLKSAFLLAQDFRYNSVK